MHDQPTVASWFSGVGGLDLGLERAGFRIVSHSEIDLYASAVLARHWPDVPNLGDISKVGVRPDGRSGLPVLRRRDHAADEGRQRHRDGMGPGDSPWTRSDVWAGGPPCQGFSVAGKRRGLRDHRSGLASVWLDLVERYRPRALVLENVPGILSSARGLDWYALLGAVGDAGYWWAYRVLDGQWSGVPQRRRRVFLVALDAERHPDPDGPAQVLAVGARCGRDHAAEREAWASAAGRAGYGADIAGSLTFGGHGGIQPNGQDAWTNQLVVDRQAPDPAGVRAPDGLAGRLDGGGMAFVKAQAAHHSDDHERWEHGAVSGTLDGIGLAPRPATAVVTATLNSGGNEGGFRTEPGEHLAVGYFGAADDPLLPLGLDSHRYRCCGNGVITPVAEWIGRRLMAYLERRLEAAA